MDWPSSSTSPEMRMPRMESFIRLNTRTRVDLPQPDGPMMAVMAFGLIAQRHADQRLEFAVPEIQGFCFQFMHCEASCSFTTILSANQCYRYPESCAQNATPCEAFEPDCVL